VNRTLAAGALAATALAALPAAAAAKPYQAKVVVRNLNNPRHLFLTQNGIYVAEAGRGGTACGAVGEGPPEETQVCVGGTSSVGVLQRGRYRRIATGLFSGAAPGGAFATGVDDVAVDPLGRVYGIVTSTNPPIPAFIPASLRSQLGRVIRIRSGGRVSFGPRVDLIEQSDPDKQGKDTDPYGIVATAGRQYVVDAAGNDLLVVRRGHVKVAAVFPNIRKGVQSVPTSIRVGPDGALYVGELAGFAPGAARVWRIVPGQKPRVYAKGFTTITGLAFGPDGSLYVSEFSRTGNEMNPQGDVVRRTPRGRKIRIGVGKLFAPGGVAVDRRGRIYVSNNSVATAKPAAGGPVAGKTGEIVRFSR
jgi:sugar lactone lactonase YvrE